MTKMEEQEMYGFSMFKMEKNYKNNNYGKNELPRPWTPVSVLNLTGRELSNAEIEELLHKIRCSDLHIVDLSEDYNKEWNNSSQATYKEFVDRLYEDIIGLDIGIIVIENDNYDAVKYANKEFGCFYTVIYSCYENNKFQKFQEIPYVKNKEELEAEIRAYKEEQAKKKLTDDDDDCLFI